MLGIYEELATKVAAMPVVAGRKSRTESFAGANCTYTIEAMMGDRRALQVGVCAANPASLIRHCIPCGASHHNRQCNRICRRYSALHRHPLSRAPAALRVSAERLFWGQELIVRWTKETEFLFLGWKVSQ